jgi:hypothetical protein
MSSATAVGEHEPVPSAAEEAAPAAAQVNPWVVRAAYALALAPLAVSAVNLTLRYGNAYNPIGDLAMTELVTRDVGSRAVVLGPFSRDGWHHPGPALYYLLVLPYRLLGSTSTALSVAALAINGASVAGMAAIARRRGGVTLMLLTLVGCALVMRSLGPNEVRLAWNPYITVLPYGLLVFLTWALTCRDRWALPWAVFVASFVAQTHIGYVALALPLLVFGTVWLIAASRSEWRRLVAPAVTAAAVGLVMWLPAVIQQLTNEPGNLGVALKWFRHGGVLDEEPRGFLLGWRAVSAQFGLPPGWLFGESDITMTAEPVYLSEPLAPVLLVLVAGAAWLLWRFRPEGARRLVALWAFASAVGVVAVARTVGLVFEYRLGWTSVLGMVAGVIVAWAAWLAVVRRRPALEQRVLVPVSLLVLAVLAVVGSVAHVAGDGPTATSSSRIRHLVPEVVDALPAEPGVVVVDGRRSIEGLIIAPGLLLQLERRGIDARLPGGDDPVGSHRVAGPDDDIEAELVVVVYDQIAEAEADPAMTMVAYDGEVTLDEVLAETTANDGGDEGDGDGDEAVPLFTAVAVYQVAPLA